MRPIELDLKPGVVAALLFVFLDIITVGILDIVLARVVCLAYYRSINEGRPVSVRSADIPGLSNYLLGRWFSLTNGMAVLAKIALLAVVLTANMSIQSKASVTVSKHLNATFEMDPSDDAISKANFNKVRRRFESSKSCFVENGETLTYYQLRFNLRNGQYLTGNDWTDKPEEKDILDVNDSSVLCMSPENVNGAKPWIVVANCTRKAEGSCLTVVSMDVTKDVSSLARDESEEYDEGEIAHNFLDFRQEDVNTLWKEYANPKLTCLTTDIGIELSDSGPSRYSHCLMVSVENGRTYVERWILGTGKDKRAEGLFFLEYPGIVFEGKYQFGRKASARYLELPFPFTDYRTLSGDLIAQASQYKFDPKRIGTLENAPKGTVTTVGYYAVGLVVASVVAVLIGFLVTVCLLRGDKRPRFNTINGLSSIVREEHDPSGRSYDLGESAVLGLRFTNADSLHFGPLNNMDEGTAYREDYDIS